ncbi:hypothetical protein [Sinorhizobium meliloti]|uniref:hypothetical protein n=1 Tax=Rhizobium meliloti TaxID=382 RepID=UPI0018E28763|nr:hypothetical protein [Sinorhizobium meliloti]
MIAKTTEIYEGLEAETGQHVGNDLAFATDKTLEPFHLGVEVDFRTAVARALAMACVTSAGAIWPSSG